MPEVCKTCTSSESPCSILAAPGTAVDFWGTSTRFFHRGAHSKGVLLSTELMHLVLDVHGQPIEVPLKFRSDWLAGSCEACSLRLVLIQWLRKETVSRCRREKMRGRGGAFAWHA